MYNDIERLRDEPHAVRVQGDEDIQVTDEVYRRPVFLQPSYRSFSPPPHTWSGLLAPLEPRILCGGGDEAPLWCHPNEGCPRPGRYHRLPLPAEGAPLEEQFDAFIRFLRVSQGKALDPWGLLGVRFAPVLCQRPWLPESIFWFSLTLPVRGCLCLQIPFPLL